MPFDTQRARRVTIRIENEDGTVVEHSLPGADELLLVELNIDRPTVLAGVTQNAVQRSRPGPVSFVQLSVVVKHRE